MLGLWGQEAWGGPGWEPDSLEPQGRKGGPQGQDTWGHVVEQWVRTERSGPAVPSSASRPW